jgi:anti-sigma factor RsiW
MKCHDVCELLDERRLSELTTAEITELEAHVSHCAECARQCLASEQVTHLRSDVPPMPASLHERARRLHAACESAASPKVSRRPLIVGSLLLGGAAAMFAAVPRFGARTVSQ